MKENKPKCYYCKKTLIPIGNSRTNGKFHDDWKTRKYHKKCWIEILNSVNITTDENFNQSKFNY